MASFSLFGHPLRSLAPLNSPHPPGWSTWGLFSSPQSCGSPFACQLTTKQTTVKSPRYLSARNQSHRTSEASVNRAQNRTAHTADPTAHDSEMFFLPFSGLNQGFTRPQGAARAVSPIYFVLPVVLIFSFYYLRRSPPESGKLEPENERSDSSGRTKKSPGDESSANLTPSEGVSPDEGNASNKLLPPAAEPGLQMLHDCEAPKIEYVNAAK